MVLQYAILGILTKSPMTGYYLGKIFGKSVNYAWTASLSQIYRELAALEKKGYVLSEIEAQEDRPDKKIYTITKAGEKAFMEWLNNFPDSLLTEKRDEFMVRIFYGSKLEKEELKKQFRRFVEERENFKKMMAQDKLKITEISKSLKIPIDKDELCMSFIVKRAVMSTETLIQWAKECIKELEMEEGI